MCVGGEAEMLVVTEKYHAHTNMWRGSIQGRILTGQVRWLTLKEIMIMHWFFVTKSSGVL